MHRGGTAHRREIPRDFGKGWKAKVWHFGRGPSWSVVKQCQRFKLPLGTSTCISWAVPTSGTRKLPTSAKNNSLSFFSRLSLPIDILGDGYLLLTLFVSACSLYPTDLLSETLLSLESISEDMPAQPPLRSSCPVTERKAISFVSSEILISRLSIGTSSSPLYSNPCSDIGDTRHTRNLSDPLLSIGAITRSGLQASRFTTDLPNVCTSSPTCSDV